MVDKVCEAGAKNVESIEEMWREPLQQNLRVVDIANGDCCVFFAKCTGWSLLCLLNSRKGTSACREMDH